MPILGIFLVNEYIVLIFTLCGIYHRTKSGEY